ncbi:helix-turn-helix domain-containing protein [Tepidibacter sp. Z1-5]|uniref:helix-turn-helix domain-containing protein n=1 Tax=Tepidibacter sp. Z1-5 TaxID=3134138 RepID=UPI0030C44122
MPKLYQNLGNTIRNYRKSKNYSTAQLADKLNVSAGLINNLENSRNDVFRIELLTSLIKELDIPLEELFQLDPINIRPLHINNEGSLYIKKLDTESEDIINFINHSTNLVIRSLLSTISEYDSNKQAIEYITQDIISHLQILRNLKNIDEVPNV